MDKENYRKVVKICEKGRCKVRENFILEFVGV